MQAGTPTATGEMQRDKTGPNNYGKHWQEVYLKDRVITKDITRQDKVACSTRYMAETAELGDQRVYTETVQHKSRGQEVLTRKT